MEFKFSKLSYIFLSIFVAVLLLSWFLGKSSYSFYEGMENTDTSSSTTTNNSNYIGNGSAIQDNYNHYTGSSYPTVFYGPNNFTAKITYENGVEIISVSSSDGSQTNVYHISQTDSNGNQIYTDSNGDTAIIIKNNDNTMAIQVTMNGTTQVYTENNTGNTGSSSSSTYNGNIATNTSSSKVFYGPNGASAQIFNNGGVNALKITYSNGRTNIYAQNTNTGNSGSVQSYTDKNGNTATLVTVNGKPQYEVTNIDGTKTIYSFGGGAYTPSTSTSTAYNSYSGTTYNGANGGSAGSVTGSGGNTVGYVTGPNGNTVVGTSSGSKSADNSSQYYINMGVSSSDIPYGEEDKYILKSEIISPTCPLCQPVVKCDNKKNQKPPPCPACSRCPEPSVTCQAVPNYNSENINRYLPQAVLNDFSTFGM